VSDPGKKQQNEMAFAALEITYKLYRKTARHHNRQTLFSSVGAKDRETECQV